MPSLHQSLELDGRRLWSLWDMLKFHPGLCGSMFAGLTRARLLATHKEPNDFIGSDKDVAQVDSHLLTAMFLGKTCGLPESLRCATDLYRYFKPDDEFNVMQFKELEVGIDHLLSLLRSELKGRLFFQIPSRVASYYHDPKDDEATRFGEKVDNSFPSVRNDVISSGKALACGLHNAAVYHLVCVAEVGLRALAWDRRIIVKHNKKVVPLEFAQWGELINKIEPQVAAIKNWKSKTLGAEAQQFYNKLLVEVRAFNAGWRTHVMHARSLSYQEDETVALFGHVKRFMQTLSERISETTRTPKVWRKS